MNPSTPATARKRAAAIGAGAGATALGLAIISTSGFGLWSDSADVDGATITAGQLAVAATGLDAQDVSPDRADGPHAITDLGTWRAVPGDVVQLDYALDVALEGDNLVAALDYSALTDGFVADGAADHVTVTAELRDAAGNVIAPVNGSYHLQAAGAGQNAGQDDPGITIVGAALDGTPDVTARITITFSADTPDQVLTTSPLGSVDGDAVTLTQVRTPGVGGFQNTP